MRDYYGKPLKDELLEFANKLAVDYMLQCRIAWKFKLATSQDNYDRCHELFAPFFIDHKSLPTLGSQLFPRWGYSTRQRLISVSA